MSEAGPEGPACEAHRDLTAGELGQAVRVEISSIHRWCREGRVPARKVGRVWQIDREALERADPDLWAEYVEGAARVRARGETLPRRRAR